MSGCGVRLKPDAFLILPGQGALILGLHGALVVSGCTAAPAVDFALGEACRCGFA